MDLCPSPSEHVARARADLRMGLPVAVRWDGVVWVFAATETISAQRLDAMAAYGGVHLGITGRRAETLKARVYDGDLARVVMPDGADLRWVRAVADPKDDLNVPMKGPLQSARSGSSRPWAAALALAKSAHVLPAVLGVEVDALPDGLTCLQLEMLENVLTQSTVLSDLVSARVPVREGPGRLHVFRPSDGGEEHYAFEVGLVDRSAPVLVRLHSACFTGDVLGSLKCDCGPQLRAALMRMGDGGGVLLYLNQEGRGIGLANKMRAYALQDQGFDTVEANHRLGFEDDERDFTLGAALLKDLGIGQVRLLTNNPRKVDMLASQGITVTERVPLKVGETRENAAYLATKACKSGHLL